MRAEIAAVFVAAALAGASAAEAACPGGRPGHCVDLDLVPQISQQIVAAEPVAAAPKAAPEALWKPAYTGPIVGLAKNVRRAPTVGYRWSLE
ncbi:MAG: hypothetical protein ACM3JG_17735 [Thiohalocapsa sp.]